MRPISRLLLLAAGGALGTVVACGPAAGEPSLAAEPSLTPAARAPVAEPAPGAREPTRERGWVLLQGWVRGADVDREPTRCPLDDEVTLAERGKALFALYCVNCHGRQGRGDGPRSPAFDPPPRDLSKGIFKFRSTPSGSPPSREDLFRTISGGLRGTGMMPFADLPEDDRWALVAWVRTLAGQTALPAEPLAVRLPDPVDLAPGARLERGALAYSRLGCANCHGERGRGDGPSSTTLRDDAGRPIRALDFATKPLKRGDAPADLLLTLVTGLDGTPMPSYEGAASNRDLRDVVAYLTSLRTDRAAVVDPRDREEADRLVQGQYAQAVHTVVGGCSCSH